MEAASEKRARGRPRRLTGVSAEVWERAVFGRMVATARGRQDRVYADIAATQLRAIQPDAWVLDSGRQGLLTQLGRLLYDDKLPPARRTTAFFLAVDALEKDRPKTKAGERALRRIRQTMRDGR